MAVVTEGQPAAPAYFAVRRRRATARPTTCSTRTRPPPGWRSTRCSPAQAAGRRGARHPRRRPTSPTGHLRGSLNVGLGGRFAEYAGDVIAAEQPIVLVGDPGTEQEAKVRLARIGFDHVVGVLADPLGAFLDRPDAVVASSRLTAAELEDAAPSSSPTSRWSTSATPARPGSAPSPGPWSSPSPS